MLDAYPDLSARCTTNGQLRAVLRQRTADDVRASREARRRCHQVVNALIAASIEDAHPEGGRGDIVADETIITLAGPRRGLGSCDEKLRAAAYPGRYFLRDRVDHSLHDHEGKVRTIGKQGVGIGVTAVSRVGPPGALYAVPPVVTGISIGYPTSGSIEALSEALSFHKENGFEQRKGTRSRLPYLTVDMGYNQKKGFNDLCLDSGYAPIARYPSSWGRVVGAGDEHLEQPVGPVQISGELYCPAAKALVGEGKFVHSMETLLAKNDGFEVHDRFLEMLFPMMMGRNSRLRRVQSRPGRPSKDSSDPDAVSMDVVCPAVQGRVRCPLKPESMHRHIDGAVPVVDPQWSADRYRCCAKSQVTYTLTPDQWRLAQWGLPPSSWEHALYFESARTATERIFSVLKSPHLFGFESLSWGPKREPALFIVVALWVAATNMFMQESYYARRRRKDSMQRRWSMLAEDIGRDPVKIPART